MRSKGLIGIGVVGLTLGLFAGGATSAALRRDTSTAVSSESPVASNAFEGSHVRATLPAGYQPTFPERNNEVGVETGFATANNSIVIEQIPNFAQANMGAIEDVAERFATERDASVSSRRVGDFNVYSVSWQDAGTEAVQYFIEEGNVAVGLRSQGDLPAAQKAQDLDAVVSSLTITAPSDEAPTNAEPAPSDTAEIPTSTPVALPTNCLGSDMITLRITNVKEYANSRSGPGIDYPLVARLNGGTLVEWTGETHKKGKWNWHEVVPDGMNECVWVAHTLLEES